jgi:hypothetical protein
MAPLLRFPEPFSEEKLTPIRTIYWYLQLTGSDGSPDGHLLPPLGALRAQGGECPPPVSPSLLPREFMYGCCLVLTCGTDFLVQGAVKDSAFLGVRLADGLKLDTALGLRTKVTNCSCFPS